MEQVTNELKSSGKLSDEQIKKLAPFKVNLTKFKNLTLFKVFNGNRPTSSILFKKLTPKTLGALIGKL